MSEKPRTVRDTPPDDDEWEGVWSAIEKADKGWMIVGPIHAVVSNWKALSAVVAVVVWFNRGGVLEIASALLGAAQ